MSVTRFEVPETIARIRKVNGNGDETYYDDCVVGIELRDQGELQFDFRNVRPIRVNDRENLIIEMDVSEVMHAIVEQIRDKVKT